MILVEAVSTKKTKSRVTIMNQLNNDSDDELVTVQYTEGRDLNREEIERILEAYRIAEELNANEDVSDLENFKL